MLEASLNEEVETRDLVPGPPQEETVCAELAPQLEKVSFPSAQIELGRYVTESDDIVAFLAAKSGREIADMPAYRNYVEGPFSTLMRLWKENQELKKAAATA